MQSAIFNAPVIKVESLKTKFDTIVVSNSFVALIGDYIEARIVQQLHYWSYSEYGVIINDIRWIYKPIREWLSEAFIGFSSWQLRTAIASLVAKGILLKEHLFKEHHGHNFAPKNRTYYYSVNYEQLEKLFLELETAGNTENVCFVSPTKQFCENSEKQFCENVKNKTENTSIENISNNSIENISNNKSHPENPCVGKDKKDSSQEKEQYKGNPKPPKFSEINSTDIKEIKKEKNISQLETQIDLNKLQKSNRPLPKVKVTTTKHQRENKAPWQDEAEKSQFYRALIQALPIVANSYSPQGLAKSIIDQLKRGEEHTYWDDFAASLPIGESTKPAWEIEPGVPYPMFIEYLTEKIIKGNNTQTNEKTRNEVFRILKQPRQATAFWGQFKRSLINVSEQTERDRTLGVSNPNTPVWTRERIEPSVEEAIEAGKKIMAINDGTELLESKDTIPVVSSLLSSNPISSIKTKLNQVKTSQNKSNQVTTSTDSLDGEDICEAGSSDVSSQFSHDSSPPISPSFNNLNPVRSSLIKFNQVSPAPDLSGGEDICEAGFSEKPQLSWSEMLAERGVKGFAKTIPKASKDSISNISQTESEAEDRKQTKSKIHIAQLSLAEINDYLKDPILRVQLTPQLFHSNYELITDELGQYIGVKLSKAQIREKERLERESI